MYPDLQSSYLHPYSSIKLGTVVPRFSPIMSSSFRPTDMFTVKFIPRAPFLLLLLSNLLCSQNNKKIDILKLHLHRNKTQKRNVVSEHPTFPHTYKNTHISLLLKLFLIEKSDKLEWTDPQSDAGTQKYSPYL